MKEAFEFEDKHGSESFVKVCLSALNRLLVEKGIVTDLSALNRLLVEKGIVTEEELEEALLTEMSNVEKNNEV